MNKTFFRIVIFLATIGMIIFLSVPEVDAKGGGVARGFNTKMALVRLANKRKTRTNGVSTKSIAERHIERHIIGKKHFKPVNPSIFRPKNTPHYG